MSDHCFYAGGLRFSCTRCSACCRFDPGYVFLSQKDLSTLADHFRMDYSEFQRLYCRWIPMGNHREQLSLRELSNYDCIFWKDGCTVYEARPLQCRTFPFWDSIVLSSRAWEAASKDCPGIGKGAWHSQDEIDELLDRREREPIIFREVS